MSVGWRSLAGKHESLNHLITKVWVTIHHWAVYVEKNWRLTFTFEGSDAVLVDYQDYH